MQNLVETTRVNGQHRTIEMVMSAPPRTEVGYIRYCPTCGHQNPDDVDICLNCATVLGANCPACGQVVLAGSKFCGQCGARLTEDGRSPPLTLPQADKIQQNLRGRIPTALAEKINAASVKNLDERREVTVLFLDVINFTAVSHDLDSEDVYLFIDEAMSLLAEVVYKYEGAIDKFTGDGLMALFGAPIAHENDPERAVRAGLEMQSALQPLQTRIKQAYGFNFQTRIGINTGPVIAGKVGSDLHMEYTVIGDTVNLASRLESAAKPNTILVSEETYQRIQPLFQFETLPPLAIKGVPEPIQAFRPVGLLEKPGSVRGLPNWQVPMIGRANDLTQLQHALTVVRWQSRFQVALVTGEAGVGKTRLVTEFCRASISSDVKVYQGNCLTYARSTPLWVVADLLRDMMHLPQTAASDLQEATLKAYLEYLGLANDDIFLYLGQVLGLTQVDPQLEARLEFLDAAMLQRQTHVALRQVFLAQARLAPTVLIFEDLHWVDPASKEFLEYLIQTTDNVPLLLILVSRQAERETVIQPLLAAAKQEPQQLLDLQLQALSDTEGSLLVDQLIEQNTVEAWALKKQIVKRAEGNPFYVEEIIRMLIDQGGLISESGDEVWQVTPRATELLKAIPGTVKGLILARFDRLPESIRQTLQKASVLGTSFPVSLLQLLNGIDPETLATHLNELEARQFLCAAPFRSEPGYTFRHALFQETVYRTLLKRDRRQIHFLVAQAIEQNTSWPLDEFTEALAYHYFESTNPAQAIPYLIAAAENAARRCAYETAIEHYQRVMGLLPDQSNGHGEEFFRVRIGLSRSLKFVGELSQADRLLSETLELLWSSSLADESSNLESILIESLRQLADVRQREGAYEEAITYLDGGLQVMGVDGAQEQPNLWRALLDRMAWIRFRQGQLEEAAALAGAATNGFSPEDANDPIRLASIYNTLGGVAWQQGHLDQAVGYVERSLHLHEEVGYFRGKAVAYGNLGVLYDALGNWSQAVDYYKQAYALQDTIGDRQSQTVNLINMGVVHMRMGELETARRELETALSIARQGGDTWGTAISHVNLAELGLSQFDFEDAARHVDEALVMADTIGSSEIQVQARRFLALILANKEELPAGLEVAKQALKMSQEAKLLAEEANCYRTLGILCAQADRPVDAEICLRDSLTIALKQNDPYRQGQALLGLGRMYQSLASANHSNQVEKWQADALTTLNEAAEKFKDLGAIHDLHLVQAVLADLKTDSLG